MNGAVSAQEGALQRSAQLVAEARADLGKQCSALRQDLAALVAHWKGAGALACREVLDRWDVETFAVIGELDTFETNLLATESNYRSADQAQADGMTRAARRLG
ncbi:MAG: WXG100 family type VII secretion target [Sporichthyaceae bacterium]